MEVRQIDPVMAAQSAKSYFGPDGVFYEQPERLKIIGPDRTGRIFTIIIEYPDQDDRSTIVTGFESSRRDELLHRRHRGGRRR